MAEDMGEKTEMPTSRRLSEARQKGQVAKSQDLSAAVDLIGAVLLVVIFGTGLIRVMSGVMRRVLENPVDAIDVATVGPLLNATLVECALAAAPMLALLFVVGLVSQFLQVGFLFSTEAITPKLTRLDPVAGMGRLFSRRNLVKTLVNTVKLAFVVLIAVIYIRSVLASVVGLPLLTAPGAMMKVVQLGAELSAWLLALLLVIGVVDWLFQRWQHLQDLKMTKDEVKDERRSMEGDPQVKGRRYRMMREIALNRINQSVPKADVIVTNPTHYSVAIRYDSATMKAPKVVAKGVDFMAMRIRQVGMIHRVPIVERPPLARALYAAVDVGHDISPEYYQAVAELLAYVYRLEQQQAA